MKHSSHAISMLIAKYRAVLRKTWWRKFSANNLSLVRRPKGAWAAAVLLSMAISPGLAAASETFTYTGDSADSHLQTIRSWVNSLAPLDLTNTTYNTITVNFTPSGSNSPSCVFGSYANSGNANYNIVNILSGTMTANVDGGFGNSGNADYNTINFSGGRASGVVGGVSDGGDATNNIVNISGGTASGVMGGVSYSGDSTNNTVTISGGTVSVLAGGASYGGNATNNTVNISGGTVASTVIGGLSFSNATNNTVTISGRPDLTASMLYGGNGGGDVFTGNTLNVRGYSGSVVGVQSFQNYNFYLPASITNGSTILTVTGGTPTNLAGTTVAITGIASGGASLHQGDMITLISSTKNAPSSFTGNITSGLVQYNFNYVSSNTAALQVQVSGEIIPQSKAVSEGRIAGMISINKGQDLLAGQGMESARRSMLANELTGFFAMEGSTMQYQTGSHVDLHGFSFLAGAGKKKEVAKGTNIAGFFLETGWGNYSSYNNFGVMPSINADGDSKYFGAGFLERWQKNDGQYIEGSVRAGQVKTNFHSGDLSAFIGQSTDFSISSPYYGMHIGIGKEKSVGQNLTLDTYTRFLWAYQNSSHTTIGGNSVDFDAVNSNRWQLGMKLSHKINERTTIRTGFAYQYEFSGDAKASTAGYSIDAPSLRGGTVIGELGMTINPQDKTHPFLDINLQGYAGKCKGVTGNIEAVWKF